jgi:hypothetical protein
METLLATQELPMNKAIWAKVRQQRTDLAALGDVWWQTVRHDLTPLAMTPR